MPAPVYGYNQNPQGYGSQLQGYQGGGGYAQPRAYGYRPNIQTYNPFYGQQFNEVQHDYYQNNPQAVIAGWMDANPYGQAGPAMRAQLEKWLGDQYQAYTYGLGQQGDATFWDWLGDRQQDFTNFYETGNANPYMGGQRAAYRTRWLRR
jgi:hypothetical protein